MAELIADWQVEINSSGVESEVEIFVQKIKNLTGDVKVVQVGQDFEDDDEMLVLEFQDKGMSQADAGVKQLTHDTWDTSLGIWTVTFEVFTNKYPNDSLAIYVTDYKQGLQPIPDGIGMGADSALIYVKQNVDDEQINTY